MCWPFWTKSFDELFDSFGSFHYVEWFMQHRLIHTKLKDHERIIWTYYTVKNSWFNDVYYIELISKRWMMIREALNCCCYFEWLLLHWTNCTILNYLYHAEWFVLRWIIWTTLNYLYYIKWFVQRWLICTTMNDFYYFEWFEQHWMICTTSNNLFNVELFVLRLIIWLRLILRWMIYTKLQPMLDYFNRKLVSYS